MDDALLICDCVFILTSVSSQVFDTDKEKVRDRKDV